MTKVSELRDLPAVADEDVADLEQVLKVFIPGGVDFILIGGWAAVLHGSARSTIDVDVVYSTRFPTKFFPEWLYGSPPMRVLKEHLRSDSVPLLNPATVRHRLKRPSGRCHQTIVHARIFVTVIEKNAVPAVITG